MQAFKVTGILSTNPKVYELQSLGKDMKFDRFSLANYQNKLVIVTGGIYLDGYNFSA